MSATSTALSIIEILEKILAELPPLDIIRFKRVDRRWYTLIRDSKLLQYKAWLREDCPDATHRVHGDDFKPEYDDQDNEYEYKCYIDNVSKHLHPIIVARVMEAPRPQDVNWAFQHDDSKEQDGSGSYLALDFKPLHELLKWYDLKKDTEHEWGCMSLYRPPTRQIQWETPDPENTFNLVFELTVDSFNDTTFISHNNKRRKKQNRPDYLTLSDFFEQLADQWNQW